MEAEKQAAETEAANYAKMRESNRLANMMAGAAGANCQTAAVRPIDHALNREEWAREKKALWWAIEELRELLGQVLLHEGLYAVKVPEHVELQEIPKAKKTT